MLSIVSALETVTVTIKLFLSYVVRLLIANIALARSSEETGAIEQKP